VHIYKYVYLCVYTYTCIDMYRHTHIHVCISSTHQNSFQYSKGIFFVNLFQCLCTRVYMDVYPCVCIYVCVDIRIFIYAFKVGLKASFSVRESVSTWCTYGYIYVHMCVYIYTYV